MSCMAPLVRTLFVPVEPVATAANDLTTILCVAPFDGVITEVSYVPAASLSGASTNTRKLSVVNAGQTGSGTTEAASLQLNAGVNLVAGDEKPITLSGTPANLNVAAGDVLKWVSLHIGSGIADPGGTVKLTISRA